MIHAVVFTFYLLSVINYTSVYTAYYWGTKTTFSEMCAASIAS